MVLVMGAVLLVVVVAVLAGRKASLTADLDTHEAKESAAETAQPNNSNASETTVGEANGGQDLSERISDEQAVQVSERNSNRSLPEEARDVLHAYQSQGSCLLKQAGYLDLLGNVWSCTVEGDGWVELVVIREGAKSACSTVKTLHFEVETWQRDFEVQN